MDRGLELPKVKDILVTKAVALREEFTTMDAVAAFNKYRISSAPVLNEKDEVVGFFSEGDLIKCLGNCLFYDEKKWESVSNLMTTEVKSASPEWDIFELENFFMKNHLRSAPVLDSHAHLVGIVTRRDALVALEKIAEEREGYREKVKKPVELNLREKVISAFDYR